MPLQSFIDIPSTSDFPLENLPFGVFSPTGGEARVGVALGDFVVDLSVLEAEKQIAIAGQSSLFARDALNTFLALGRPTWQQVRKTLQRLLAADNPALRDDPGLRARVFHSRNDVTMHLPVHIGDYTDFYSSYHHAHNVGTMLRGAENALMPNWKWLPVAYHGRASSVVVSGTPVRRPKGQIKPPDTEAPLFGPSRSFDFELEMAFLIGPASSLGEPISIDHATDHIFGFVLMNDWSARDIQAWEYQPLGPFLAKNFATSISPWVVTLDALEPFRKPLPPQDPEPLSYLRRANDFTFDIQLEARLQTPNAKQPQTITRTNFQNLYWSISQQLAHHAVGGCNLRTGDLLASGTISGATEDSRGCMLELTWRGAKPLSLEGGENRKWLEDDDTLTIAGWCNGDGYRIGFGEVTGTVSPA
ncbi:MAG: fumarylacetoacetase [Chthoniobacterales bacterium]